MSKLAIIILNKSNNNLLFQCLTSIKEKTSNKNYYIYIGDTGSTQEELLEIKRYLKDNFGATKNVSLIQFDYYNFGKNNNEIVKRFVQDENLILFCNNDIKLVDDCISEAIDVFEQKPNQLGTVGFKLLFGDNTIQHAGQILYVNSSNQFHQITHRGLRQSSNLFAQRDSVIGNTGGFMFTEKQLFLNIGGFNENYLDCFEDVEYNLQCLIKDKTNFYIGDKVAYHYESQTRDRDPKKSQNLNWDANYRLIPFIHKHMNKLSNTNLPTIV